MYFLPTEIVWRNVGMRQFRFPLVRTKRQAESSKRIILVRTQGQKGRAFFKGFYNWCVRKEKRAELFVWVRYY